MKKIIITGDMQPINGKQYSVIRNAVETLIKLGFEVTVTKFNIVFNTID
jgi:hypothetical protein